MKQQPLTTQESQDTTLPPELSALEASLASLEPLVSTSKRETVKSRVLIRLFESAPPMTGKKLIETIVKTGDQEITLSLREYVKSVQLLAGFYGAAIGMLLGLLIGIGVMLLIVKPVVHKVYHIPYSVNQILQEQTYK